MRYKGLIIIIIFFIIVIGIGIYSSHLIFKYENCVIDIAKEFCESKGVSFHKLDYESEGIKATYFICIDEGERENKRFSFLEEEKEKCST